MADRWACWTAIGRCRLSRHQSDVKVLKEIVKLRKQDKDERDEHETLLDVYMRAMESTSPAPVAEAA